VGETLAWNEAEAQDAASDHAFWAQNGLMMIL
jgi:hypothetical protein